MWFVKKIVSLFDYLRIRIFLRKLQVQALDEAIQIQLQDGHWNADPYMFGMANGMLFAQSIFTDKHPIYLEAPAEWLVDKHETEPPAKTSTAG